MEKALKERFEVMCDESCLVEQNRLVYKFFDFHHECHKNTNPMIQLIESEFYPNLLKNYGIFESMSTVKELRTGNLVT